MKHFDIEAKDLIIDPKKHVSQNLSFDNPWTNTGVVNKDNRVKHNEILVNGEVFRFIKGKFCLFVFREQDDWGVKFFIDPIKGKSCSLAKTEEILKIHKILHENSLSVDTGEIVSCSTKKGEITGYGITMEIAAPQKTEISKEERGLYLKSMRLVCEKNNISRSGSVKNFLIEANKSTNRLGFICVDIDPRCSIKQ